MLYTIEVRVEDGQVDKVTVNGEEVQPTTESQGRFCWYEWSVTDLIALCKFEA